MPMKTAFLKPSGVLAGGSPKPLTSASKMKVRVQIPLESTKFSVDFPNAWHNHEGSKLLKHFINKKTHRIRLTVAKGYTSRYLYQYYVCLSQLITTSAHTPLA